MIGEIDCSRIIKQDSKDFLKNVITFGDTVLLIRNKYIFKCYFIGTSTTGLTLYFITDNFGTLYSDEAKHITIKYDWLDQHSSIPEVLKQYEEFLNYCKATKPKNKVFKFCDYKEIKGI